MLRRLCPEQREQGAVLPLLPSPMLCQELRRPASASQASLSKVGQGSPSMKVSSAGGTQTPVGICWVSGAEGHLHLLTWPPTHGSCQPSAGSVSRGGGCGCAGFQHVPEHSKRYMPLPWTWPFSSTLHRVVVSPPLHTHLGSVLWNKPESYWAGARPCGEDTHLGCSQRQPLLEVERLLLWDLAQSFSL